MKLFSCEFYSGDIDFSRFVFLPIKDEDVECFVQMMNGRHTTSLDIIETFPYLKNHVPHNVFDEGSNAWNNEEKVRGAHCSGCELVIDIDTWLHETYTTTTDDYNEFWGD